LHLQIEDYKGDLVLRGSDGKYRITRMLPPGTHRYFFSV
jgi:hypothetical protein